MIAEKTFDCSLETITEVRRWVMDVLSEHKTPMNVVDDVVLATNEAVTNAVVHGYKKTSRGRVDMGLQLADGSISLTIRDYGSGIGGKPYTAPDTSVPHEGGYGVFLLHSLMDEVEVRSLDEGTEVRMKKVIKPTLSS